MMSTNASTKRTLAALALLAMLTGCATTGGGRAQTGNYTGLYERAEADVQAGRVDAALVSWAEAAKADPSRKEPWVRAAQLQFDRGNYASAILAAEEALQRDPTDIVADSVLAVGGFRIANQSLLRLRGNGALASETARAEAELLVKTLRETMGEQIMSAGAAPRPEPARRTGRSAARTTPAVARPAAAAEPAKKKNEAPAADPFKNIGGN